MHSKRAISSFIATLLLMVLAVSAGVILYTYTMGYVGGIEETKTTGKMSYDEGIMLDDTVDIIKVYIRNLGEPPIILDAAYVADIKCLIYAIDGVLVEPNGVKVIEEGQVGLVEIHKPSNPPAGYDWVSDSAYDVLLIAKDNTKLSFKLKCIKNTASSSNVYTLTFIPSVGGSSVPSSTHSYPEGTIVNIVANEDIGYIFSNWNLDGSNIGSKNPVTVLVDQDHNIKAEFTPVSMPQHSLTVDIIGDGTVELSPSGGVYDQNTVVIFTAIPDTGWSFNSWSGDLSGNNSPKSLTMDEDKKVTATFTLSTPQQITVTKSPSLNSGKWNSPEYAYNDDTSAAASSSQNDRHTYADFGFNIPSGSTINQVKVRLDAWCSMDDLIRLEVSDGSWHTLPDISLIKSENTIWVDITTISSGGWNISELSIIQIRVTHIRQGSTDLVYLDWIPIVVTYTFP